MKPDQAPAAATAAAHTHTSAITRLRTLPSTFSIEQMCTLLGLPKEIGLTYASRWVRAGHLRPAGARTGFYANLVRAPHFAQSDDWLAGALLHVYPSAIVAGASVLNAEGWITQHPHDTQVAVLAPANRSSVHGYDTMPRSRRWFITMDTNRWVDSPLLRLRHESGRLGTGKAGRTASLAQAAHGSAAAQDPAIVNLPRLHPAAALADLFSSPSCWHPDEDDLEIPDNELDAVATAFNALHTPMPPWLAQRCDQARLNRADAQQAQPHPDEDGCTHGAGGPYARQRG